MRQKSNTRSGLFLMELIIAILFFSLAGAVCLRMFAKSHELSIGADALNHAVNKASDMAEVVRYELIHSSEAPAPEQAVYYTEDWNTCEAEASDAAYVLTVTLSDTSEHLVTGSITVRKTDGASVYELPLTVYTGREAS